jgi:ParB family chromosome partitioning protein
MERRLGRGLGSLLGSRPSAATASDAPVVLPTPSAGSREDIPLDRIRPNPFQPRQVFDAAGLQELKASITNHGILQPVVVRAIDDGFELVSGERRWRAARLAGLTAIPAVIRPGVSDDDMLELALVENVQRRDLDPIERAIGYRSMVDRLGLTQEEVAQRVGLQRATVANHLRLLDLPESIRQALSGGRISMGHARALLAMEPGAEQAALAQTIEREGLSVREVERRVREWLAPREGPADTAKLVETTASASSGAAPGPAGADLPRSGQPWARALEERLKHALGTKVEIRVDPSSESGMEGQVLLHFYDRRQLEVVVDRLAPPQRL